MIQSSPRVEGQLRQSVLQRIATAVPSPSTLPTSQRQIAETREDSSKQEAIVFDAINPSEAAELYSAVRALRPTDSAEIGFCCGGSAMAILQALEDNQHGTHHVCDPYQTSYARGAGLSNVEQEGLSARLRFYEAFPESAVPGFPRLQFAFIDASHLFDLSILDFVLIDKRLDVGGVVGFHDLWMPSLQAVVRYMLANRGYEVYRAPSSPPASRSHWVHRTIANLLRRLPGAEKIFSQRLLRPWSEIGVPGNVALLRKTADDTRDWRHFAPF